MAEPDTIIVEIERLMDSGRTDLAMAYALGAINSIAEFSRPDEYGVVVEMIQNVFRTIFPPVLVS